MEDGMATDTFALAPAPMQLFDPTPTTPDDQLASANYDLHLFSYASYARFSLNNNPLLFSLYSYISLFATLLPKREERHKPASGDFLTR
jgi:hypothetical protein